MYDMVLVSLPEMDKDKPSPALGFIKAYIEQHGFTVKTIDGNQIGDIDSIHLTISQYEYKYLGISVFSYEQVDFALELGEEYENVIYGGSGVHKDWPHGDYIVGEGELALLEYLRGNKYYPGINGRAQVQIPDLAILPPPDYSDLNHSAYTSAVISGSRGCVRACTFCDVASIWPKYRFLGGERIAQHMHAVSTQTGFKSIGFSDSLVNGSMNHFREMCSSLANIDKKIKWSGQFIIRPKKTFLEKDFNNLANSGCSGLTIGIESGSEAVRYHMKKKFSDDDLEWFITNIGDRGIKMKFLLIVGYPTETKEDFLETLEMLKKFKRYAPTTEISPHMMLVDKNTPLDYNHRDLYDDFGFKWTNENSDYDERYRRFLKVFEVGTALGYKFKDHATNKIEKFNTNNP